jgi:SAM-dependent methyltransferase
MELTRYSYDEMIFTFLDGGYATMKESRVYIYGAGKYGKRLYEHIKSIGCEIDGFIQTKLDDERQWRGVRIYSIDDFAKNIASEQIDMGEIKVAIAISDNKVGMEILGNLIGIGIPRGNIWSYREFLQANACTKKDVRAGGNSCNICGVNGVNFEDYPLIAEESFYETHKMIGAGYRKNSICPVCSSVDRYRWFYWILQNKTDILEKQNTVLHFAPEDPIYKILDKQSNIDYYPCDLYPTQGMHKVDVTDIPYRDEFFDYVIINHVLEHIADKKQALCELFRVLKQNGTVIISVPICGNLEKTFEDSKISTKEDRLKYYGQEDHVRLYGLDYKSRFSEIGGVEIREFSPKKEMDDDMISKYGFIKDDVVMLCRKKIEER